MQESPPTWTVLAALSFHHWNLYCLNTQTMIQIALCLSKMNKNFLNKFPRQTSLDWVVAQRTFLIWTTLKLIPIWIWTSSILKSSREGTCRSKTWDLWIWNNKLHKNVVRGFTKKTKKEKHTNGWKRSKMKFIESSWKWKLSISKLASTQTKTMWNCSKPSGRGMKEKKLSAETQWRVKDALWHILLITQSNKPKKKFWNT